MSIKFQKFAGIKDACDAVSTTPPFLREADNVDIDDEGKRISRRNGPGAALVSGNYHSIWSSRAETVMLGVTGSSLRIIHGDGTTTTIRSDLTANLPMDYVEVNNQIYYSNNQVLGFIDEGLRNGSFPTITKFGASSMPAGEMLEFYEERLYVVKGGYIPYSAPLDFGRTSLRSDFLWFPGNITMFKAVKDGIYCSFGHQTVFLSGRRPKDFTLVPVADYPAIKGTAVKFDASLASSNVPLQGDAVFWYSEKGPCIGFQGGQMLNLALTKYKAPTGISGAAAIRKTAQTENGFFQAVTILQN